MGGVSEKFRVIPDPYPQNPAQFFPASAPVGGRQVHEAGIWQYGNRTSAPGCRCGVVWGVAWEWPLLPSCVAGDAIQGMRSARQHVRSMRSRVVSR